MTFSGLISYLWECTDVLYRRARQKSGSATFCAQLIDTFGDLGTQFDIDEKFKLAVQADIDGLI